VSEPSPAAVVVEVGIREMIENLYESGMRKSRQSSAPAPPGGGGEDPFHWPWWWRRWFG
jgi:hypothetical protein